MPRSVSLYLGDMLQSAEAILRYTHGMDFESYESNDLTQAAVERKFEIIGEALTQLRKFHPEVETALANESAMKAFRNRIIHGYFVVDNELVWSAVRSGVPPLIESLTKLLRERPPEM